VPFVHADSRVHGHRDVHERFRFGVQLNPGRRLSFEKFEAQPLPPLRSTPVPDTMRRLSIVP
jgi:hypothetical protein